MYIDEYWSRFDQVESVWHYSFTLAYAFIFVLGIVANLMVLFYLKHKKPRRPGTYFLMNLAIADLFKICINIPMNAISSLYQTWIFEQIGCDIYVILGGLFGFVNISTLVFMSIERYLMIKNPLMTLKISSRVVFTCCALTWLYSLACVLPQLFLLEHGFVLEGLLTSCTFNYLSREPRQTVLMLAMFVFGFFVPLALIILFYMLMWHFLRNSSVFLTYNVRYPPSKSLDDSSSLLTTTTTIATATTTSSPMATMNGHNKKMPEWTGRDRRSTSQMSSRDREQSLKKEMRVARMIALIVLAFVLAWLPYALVTLFAQFGPLEQLDRYITPYTTSLPALFAKLSSVYNPVLYTLTNSDCLRFFKRFVLKKLLTKKKQQQLQLQLQQQKQQLNMIDVNHVVALTIAEEAATTKQQSKSIESAPFMSPSFKSFRQ